MAWVGATLSFYCENCGKKVIYICKGPGRRRKYCSTKCRHRRSDRHREWRYKDQCPKCGGLKMKVSKTCKHCAGTNNPKGINGR